MPRDMYRPLLAYLTALSLEQTEVTLSFAELEARCGPLSARSLLSDSNDARATPPRPMAH